MNIKELKGLVAKAREIALIWHAGQMWGDRPYIEHLDRVAEIVWQAWGCELLLVAAYLHDILEDTAYSEEEMRREFGEYVTSLVVAVSGKGANRKEKQQLIVKNLELLMEGRKLKLGDRVCNVEFSLATNNTKKLAMYRKEAALYRDLFASLNHPLALRLEAMLLPPSKGLCVCILVERNGRYLAVQRRRKMQFTGLPGGKVDDGEEPVFAALREFEEETGYVLALEDLHLLYTATDETGVVTATFIAKANAGWPQEAVGPEGTRVAFVSKEDLTSSITCEFPVYNKALFDVVQEQHQLISSI